MTGMVGVIAHDRRTRVADEDVDALAGTYEALRGAGRRTTAHAGEYARLVKIDTASADRPGIEDTPDGWAAVTGVVYGAASLRGVDPARIDGQFALVSYDRPSDRITITSDPLGLHAFYLAERDGKTYFSSSALALAKHLRAPANPIALSMLLCCGTQHGPITNWEGIERIGPATEIVFAASGVRRSTYWQPEVDETVARLSFPQAVDHCIDLLAATFRAHLAGRPRMWADLTGGYDTRLLNLLLRRAGVDCHCNTVGAPFVPDVRLGRRVARVAGLDWTHFRVPSNWGTLAPSLLAPALAWADGRLPVVQLTHVLWTQEQKGHAYRSSLAGGGGELLRDHAWLLQLVGVGRRGHVDIDQLIRWTLLDRQALSIQVGSVTDEAADYLHTLMADQIRASASSLNSTQLDLLLVRQKPVWDGIYGSAAGAHVRSELPFLLKPALTTGISIHYRHRQHRRLMRAMIERLDPRVAAIPTASGGPTVPRRVTNIHRYAPYYAGMGRFAVATLSQKLLGHSLLPSRIPEDPRILSGHAAMMRCLGLTASSMLSASLYKPGPLGELLRRATSPSFTMPSLLGRIITVELILRTTEASL